MNILVIDGMGGGIGRAAVEQLRGISGAVITAVGTNSLATAAMIKAGAHNAATGENAVVYNAAKADFIVGATGILLANAMHGEVSPKMAAAVSTSGAHKFLIPIEKCNISVAGVAPAPVGDYIKEIVNKINS